MSMILYQVCICYGTYEHYTVYCFDSVYNGTPLKGHPWNKDTSVIKDTVGGPIYRWYTHIQNNPWVKDASL